MSEIVKICRKCGPLTKEQTWSRTRGFTCKHCVQATNKKMYEKNKEKRLLQAREYREPRKEELAEWQRNYRKENKEKYRQKRLLGYKGREYPQKFHEILKKRGLTKEGHDEMLLKQQNKCAICRQLETCGDPKNDRVRRLSIDHCHKTNKTRGLLCHKCNILISFAKESHDILKKASAYLRKYNND